MKKTQTIINVLVIAGLLGLGAFQLLKKEKTVYVDINKLMQEYQGMKDAKAEYEKKSAQWKANADTLVSKWQDELKSYEKERSRMSQKERDLKEELLRNKQNQINQYQDALKMKAKDEEQKLTQNVINRVNEYITDYGKSKRYTYILGANGTGNIIYAEKSRDITAEILAGLQKDYEKEKK
jgi:outer membrane protein